MLVLILTPSMQYSLIQFCLFPYYYPFWLAIQCYLFRILGIMDVIFIFFKDSLSFQAAWFRVSFVMQRALFAAFTCILAIGGAIVGTLIGACKGQTTETGFLQGAKIGAVSGAITAVQLLELDGESLSKAALLSSLLDGKVFMECVCPAVLKAYQWQMGMLESPYRETADIFDITGVHGLSWNQVQELPVCELVYDEIMQCHDEFCCPICLQDFKSGDTARKLPNCGHFFHLNCVDKWLTRQGSCPMCRTCVSI